MDEDLSLLLERFERLEREVEALKRSSSGRPGIEAGAQPLPSRPTAPDALPPRPDAHALVEDFVLGSPIPETADLEESVVGTWFPRLGALALVLGAGFAFKYAVDRGWIGPGARVAAGVSLGLGLLLVGEATKRRGWAGYAQAVTGGGVAVLYLTVWAAFALYGMLSAVGAFGLLVVVTVAAAGLALHHDSSALAVLATLGGFLNPLVVGREAVGVTGMFAYTVALDLGVVSLASVRRWRLLDKVAFTGSWGLYGLSHASGTDAMAFATTIFVLFGSLPYLRTVVVRRRSAEAADVVQMAANAAVYEAVSLVNLPAFRGGFTLALSAAFLAQGALLFRGARGERLLRLGTLGIATTLFTIWVYLEGSSTWLPVLWGCEGLALLALGWRIRSLPTRQAAGIVLVLSLGVAAFAFEDFRPARLLLTEDAAVFACEVAILFAAAFVVFRVPSERRYAAAAGVSANLLALTWLSLEARWAIAPGGLDRESARTLAFSLSAIWGAYAGVLLTAGIAFRLRSARLLAIAVFAVTLVKMTLSDLWLIGPVRRIVSFGGIGVLLLACSLLFHRFKELVLADRSRSTSR